MRQSSQADSAVGTGLPGRSSIQGAVRGILTGLAFAFGILFVLGGALIWTMPAQSLTRLVDLPPQVRGLDGHLRAGGARLAGGYRLDWTLRPEALLGGRIVVTTRLNGADTELTGEMKASSGHVTVRDVRGRAGAGLLRLVPTADLVCDSHAALNVDIFHLGGGRADAAGRIDIAKGTCSAGGQSVPLPALRVALSSAGDDALAEAESEAGVRVGSLRITGDRRSILRIEPDGAVMIPGMPSSAATILEVPF